MSSEQISPQSDPKSPTTRTYIENFLIGFLGWPVFNVILFRFVLPIFFVCSDGGDDGLGCIGAFSHLFVLLVLINIAALVIIFIVRQGRRWIMFGMLAIIVILIIWHPW